MAKVTVYHFFNSHPDAFPFPEGTVEYPLVTPTHIRATSDNTQVDFWGSGFEVNGNDEIVDGTLTRIDYRVEGLMRFKVSGLDVDADKVYDFLADEDAEGLMRYVLSGDDEITGSAEAELMYGMGGRDVMSMGASADSAFGGGGDDTISGGAGNDLGVGGNGNDTLRGDDGDDGLYAQAGSDTLRGGNGDDYLDGGTHLDTLWGEAGNDRLIGQSGNDRLVGATGSDILDGGIGNDKLEGGADADVLGGGPGADFLIGGAGNDEFWFHTGLSAVNVDTISDFKGPGAGAGDVIVLEDAIFRQLEVGPLDEDNFVKGGSNVSAQESDDFILYDTTTGSLYYDRDGDGAAAAVKFAVITGSPDGLTYEDFTVA